MTRTALLVTDRRLLPAYSGNRLRILGLMRALRELGWKVVLVASDPGPTEALRPVCDGLVRVRASPFAGGALSAFDARPFRRAVVRAAATLRAEVAIAEYAWLAPALDALPPSVERWVDCHDVLHERSARFIEAGLDPWTVCTREEEAALLAGAHTLITCQERDADVLRALLPGKRVACVVTPVDLPPGFRRTPGAGHTVLAVGARHAGNQGILEFAREAWPRVLARVPEARLRIVGTVGEGLEPLPGVDALGAVPSVHEHYADAAVVICPVTVGSGVKTKMLEAMRLGRAVVATTASEEGIPVPERRAWAAADSLDGCADAVADLLTDGAERAALEEAGFAYAERHVAHEVFRAGIGALLPAAEGGVSVVVTHAASDRELRRCLRAILAQAEGHVIRELIVVEHGRDRAGAAHALARRLPWVTVVRASGSAESARRSGEALASAAAVVFLDSARVPAPGWLARSRAAAVPNHGSPDDAGDLPMRSVSVVVPSAGWPATLDACVASLRAQAVDVPVEVVVVVNGPEGPPAGRDSPGVVVLHEPKRGPAAARNAGVRAASGDVIAFIDADCVADARWLAGALAAMRGGAAGSIVAGAITRSREDRGWVSFYDSLTFLQQERYARWAGNFVTANLIVHRTLFDRLGPFDERFDEAAFEDWEWALRARRMGIPVMYAAGAVVDHPCFSRVADLRRKAERLARGERIMREAQGGSDARPGLARRVRDQLRRARRDTRVGPTDRLRLMCVGVAVGFWMWSASRRLGP